MRSSEKKNVELTKSDFFHRLRTVRTLSGKPAEDFPKTEKH